MNPAVFDVQYISYKVKSVYYTVYAVLYVLNYGRVLWYRLYGVEMSRLEGEVGWLHDI